jgi:prepilin peptidase dependent protein B
MRVRPGHCLPQRRSDRTVVKIAQRGLSMVELLVGVAIALFIAAAGATLLAANLRENRSLLLEARLMQDLRTATDVISRDLRRAGYWAAATDGVSTTATPAAAANPYVALAPGAAASDAVSFRYSRDATENNVVDGNEQFGFRLRNRVIEMLLGAGNWQALTDAGTLDITEFSVTPTVQEIDLRGYCSQPCPAGSLTCPPRQQVRSLALVVAGRSTSDASVTRSLRSNVRLRNDALSGACPG